MRQLGRRIRKLEEGLPRDEPLAIAVHTIVDGRWLWDGRTFDSEEEFNEAVAEAFEAIPSTSAPREVVISTRRERPCPRGPGGN
jgi:hypothetical protein